MLLLSCSFDVKVQCATRFSWRKVNALSRSCTAAFTFLQLGGLYPSAPKREEMYLGSEGLLLRKTMSLGCPCVEVHPHATAAKFQHHLYNLFANIDLMEMDNILVLQATQKLHLLAAGRVLHPKWRFKRPFAFLFHACKAVLLHMELLPSVRPAIPLHFPHFCEVPATNGGAHRIVLLNGGAR